MSDKLIPIFLKEACTPVAKEIGNRLTDIVSLVFTPIIKMKAVRDKNLEKFLESLNQEVEKIPIRNLQEPPLHIVGPSLEKVGKYYHDEEYLRKLFAKLIASSMDAEKCEVVHPIFETLITQLSSFDAELLVSMYKDRKEPHVLFVHSAEKVSQSLVVLNSLGLVNIDIEEYKKMFTAEEHIYKESVIVRWEEWEKFRESKICEYEHYDLQFDEDCVVIHPYERIVLNDLNEPLSFLDIRNFSKSYSISRLGMQFCKVCIS